MIGTRSEVRWGDRNCLIAKLGLWKYYSTMASDADNVTLIIWIAIMFLEGAWLK